MSPGDATLWETVVRFAERQFGVVSHAHLVGLACSPGWIHRRVRQGYLRPVHRGVYALGHSVLLPQGRWLAAALAVPAAAISHRTAAVFWRMEVAESRSVEVTSVRGARSRAAITVHRSRTLAAEDLVRWHGVYVTKPERTIVDLAAILDRGQFTRVADGLARIDLRALRAAVDRAGIRHPARTATRALLDAGPRTRSELERALLRLACAHGLGRPECNVWVAGLLVDAHWPAQRLVVECDSRRWHASWAARRDDHARDARLQLAGQRSLRVSWADVVHEPRRAAERIRPFLRP